MSDAKPSAMISLLAGLHNKTVLFRSGRIIFVTYGLLAAAAFVLGSSAAMAHAQITGRDPLELLQFTTLILFPSVMVGARLFSVLLEWRELFRAPIETLLKLGYMLHGGVAGGAVAILGYGWLSGSPALPLLDSFALALPLGEAVARLGCHVYGCCWGAECESRVGIRYTSAQAKVIRFHPHLHGKRLYPVQLFGAGAHLTQFLVFAALLPLLPTAGALVGIYLITHPIIRVVLERFRRDDRGVLLGPLTHTNLYSAIQLAAGAALLVFALKSGSAVVHSAAAPLLWLNESPTTIAYLLVIFTTTAAVFGVHIDQVGSWVTGLARHPVDRLGPDAQLDPRAGL